MSEAETRAGSVNEARNIGHADAAEVFVNEGADDGIEGGEGVGGDFGMGIGEGGEQGGFPGVGIADEADIRHELELQTVGAFYAERSGGAFVGRLGDGGFEVGVAQSAASALRNQRFLSILKNLADEFLRVGVENDGAAGYRDDDVFSAAAGTVAAFAVTAVVGTPMGVMVEPVQRVFVGVAAQNDAATASAVAAIGPAARRKFFTAEGDNAVAAVTGAQENFNAVSECNGFHGAIL